MMEVVTGQVLESEIVKRRAGMPSITYKDWNSLQLVLPPRAN